MKFFLDTANLDELKRGAGWGIVDGVTTNPTLIAREGRPISEQIKLICEIVDGDVSAEVVSRETAGMIREGRELARIHKNVVVKCPLTRDGIAVVPVAERSLSEWQDTSALGWGQATAAARRPADAFATAAAAGDRFIAWGDSFAGGFLRYLDAHQGQELSEPNLRRAMAYGSVMDSINVEEFGTQRVQRLKHDELNEMEHVPASYELVEQPEEPKLGEEAEPVKERQEAVVKAITPAQPAPLVAEPQPRAPAQARPQRSQRRPERTPSPMMAAPARPGRVPPRPAPAPPRRHGPPTPACFPRTRTRPHRRALGQRRRSDLFRLVTG